MRNIPFSSVQEINKNVDGRNITLFARGDTAAKTIRLLSHLNITNIVDNAQNLWGKEELAYTIQSPEEFLKSKEGKKSFVVICTTSFQQVSDQLSKMGFKPNQDFAVSPILNDLRIISELETIQKKLIFTSGSPPDETSDKFGGGVYELIINNDEFNYKKVISGYCYGLQRFGQNFLSVDSKLGIFEFDANYEILRSSELPEGTRAHGISYSEKTECFYVVGSYLDAVLVLDTDFKIIDKIKISNKIDTYGQSQHHCNDCFIKDNSLYVSMFSLTGNWKNEVYDGGVLEFDIHSKECIGPVLRDLWMPHNIAFFDGSLTVLDSLPGYLRRNNNQVVGQFPSFTRGLDYDGVHYYIGQSRNRNFSKNLGVSLNTGIDAGIVIFDEATKVSRSLQLPPKISEIHSIALLD